MQKRSYDEIYYFELECLLPGDHPVKPDNIDFITSYLKRLELRIEENPLIIFSPCDINVICSLIADIVTEWELAHKQS